MSLNNKIDFAVVFKVHNANPNGDPLNSNRPRVNYDGLGEVSDVCIKRKLRDRLMEKGVPIFVQSDENRADEFINLRSRAEPVLSKEITPQAKKLKACETWFDVRAFGQVFPFKAEKKRNSENPEDKGVSIGIRGPVSINTVFSIEKVDVTSSQIVKSTSLEGDGINRESDQMGMKHRVDRGIYVIFGSMNPQLAKNTGFSDKDAEAIKSVLPRLFENDASSARPDGSMEVLKVIWWQHNCPNGQLSSAKVHRSLHIEPDGSISLDDIDGLTPEVLEGY